MKKTPGSQDSSLGRSWCHAAAKNTTKPGSSQLEFIHIGGAKSESHPTERCPFTASLSPSQCFSEPLCTSGWRHHHCLQQSPQASSHTEPCAPTYQKQWQRNVFCLHKLQQNSQLQPYYPTSENGFRVILSKRTRHFDHKLRKPTGILPFCCHHNTCPPVPLESFPVS